MGPPDSPERGALTVPLVRIERSSSRRAWLTAAVWTIGLAFLTWLGLGGRGAGAVPAAAPGPAEPLTPRSTPATSRVRNETRGAPARLTAPVVYHRTLGDDGLIGGIAFGDNVPAPSLTTPVRDDATRSAGRAARASRPRSGAAPGAGDRSSRAAPRSSS